MSKISAYDIFGSGSSEVGLAEHARQVGGSNPAAVRNFKLTYHFSMITQFNIL